MNILYIITVHSEGEQEKERYRDRLNKKENRIYVDRGGGGGGCVDTGGGGVIADTVAGW